MLLIGLLAPGVGLAQQAGQPSVAIYYGHDVPVDMLNQFDWAVVEPAHMKAGQLKNLQRYGTAAFAYVSLGESAAWRDGQSDVPRNALRTDNKHWNSKAADLTRPEWADYIIDKRIRPLQQAGYRGVFLDTLDSYRLFAKDNTEAAQQQAALVALIKRIHREFPRLKLLLNRGFEVLDQVHDDIDGVAAESVYKYWNPNSASYADVSDKDSEYVRTQLLRVKNQYHLPAIAIDYVAPSKRDVARATAKRIAKAGLIPWVSDHALDQVGVGSIEPVPRKVLVLYDKSAVTQGEVANAQALRYAAMPLEYLGYGAVYQDVNAPLPSGTLTGRYAGIVSWFTTRLADTSAYRQWLTRQMKAGMHVAIFDSPGIAVTGALARRLGVQAVPVNSNKGLALVGHDDLVGYEGMPERPPMSESGYKVVGEHATAHLTLRNHDGDRFAPVVTGDWGGIALSPWVLQDGLNGQARWIVDPFKFLRKALDLPAMPVPDMTTENGSRYWMNEIDGDAFVSHADFPGSPFTGQVMRKQILRRYRVPITVSVIQGEVGPHGLYPKLSDQLEPIARKIFRLPWVEIATHTFSHPFDWGHLHEGELAGQGETAAGFAYNLPIPGYRYSLEKEVAGSTQYIDRNLAPAGKRVKTMLWSGDAVPPKKALAIAHRIGIANLNGGDTAVTQDNPSLTDVSPMLRPLGKYIQVYSPQTNENIYTNDMTEPLWGFRRVIETYKITNKPRRLKPIDIYFHFYSAASPASLNALKSVFNYVRKQQTLPLFASTYSEIARNWYHVGIARRLDGAWQITGATQARTLRLPKSLGWPDLAASNGVAGVRDMPQGRYIALTGAPRIVLRTRAGRPHGPYVQRSNGRIQQWQRDGDAVSFALKSQVVPLTLTLAGAAGCRVHAPHATRRTRGDATTLRYSGTRSGRVRISCGR